MSMLPFSTSLLRKQRSDFKKPRTSEHFYDPEFDKDLIESSLATQYGIRLRQEPDISYAEWARLVSGLMPETPLGRVVQIRMERDPKVIAKFGEYERRVRADWNHFKHSKQTPEEAQQSIEQLQNMLKNLFTRR